MCVTVAYLKEQNAITEEESLTAIGNMLSQLPVDEGVSISGI